MSKSSELLPLLGPRVTPLSSGGVNVSMDFRKEQKESYSEWARIGWIAPLVFFILFLICYGWMAASIGCGPADSASAVASYFLTAIAIAGVAASFIMWHKAAVMKSRGLIGTGTSV